MIKTKIILISNKPYKKGEIINHFDGLYIIQYTYKENELWKGVAIKL